MFVIYNVFSITAAQRQRENALLRAIGASRRQVTWTMLLEAPWSASSARLPGWSAAIGLAIGIRKLLDALDYSHPVREDSRWSRRPWRITIVAGVAASLIAAIVPAIGAGRVPPVAAMGETAFERTGVACAAG